MTDYEAGAAMMKECIKVPLQFMGKTIKLPFLLFVGWTVEERREYAAALRKILEARPYCDESAICFISQELRDVGTLTDREYGMVRGFFDTHMDGGTLPMQVLGVNGLEHAYDLRTLWLETQIGMVDVCLELNFS